MRSETGSQDAFHSGVLCELCRHQEHSSEVTVPHPEPTGKAGASARWLPTPEPQHVLSFLSSEDRVKSPGALRTQAVEAASSSWLQTCSSASPKSRESHLPIQPSTLELSCFNSHLLKFSRMIKVTVIFFSFVG